MTSVSLRPNGGYGDSWVFLRRSEGCFAKDEKWEVWSNGGARPGFSIEGYYHPGLAHRIFLA